MCLCNNITHDFNLKIIRKHFIDGITTGTFKTRIKHIIYCISSLARYA